MWELPATRPTCCACRASWGKRGWDSSSLIVTIRYDCSKVAQDSWRTVHRDATSRNWGLGLSPAARQLNGVERCTLPSAHNRPEAMPDHAVTKMLRAGA